MPTNLHLVPRLSKSGPYMSPVGVCLHGVDRDIISFYLCLGNRWLTPAMLSDPEHKAVLLPECV